MVTYGDLFRYLDNELEHGQGAICDNTLERTEKFAKQYGLPFERLARILRDSGLRCDCDVLLHGAEVILAGDAIGRERFKTIGRYAIEQDLYWHCLIEGKPATWDEALEAEEGGAKVEWGVPCKKDDPCAEPDLDRAKITPL